jgi:hypothetical protein
MAFQECLQLETARFHDTPTTLSQQGGGNERLALGSMSDDSPDGRGVEALVEHRNALIKSHRELMGSKPYLEAVSRVERISLDFIETVHRPAARHADGERLASAYPLCSARGL